MEIVPSGIHTGKDFLFPEAHCGDRFVTLTQGSKLACASSALFFPAAGFTGVGKDTSKDMKEPMLKSRKTVCTIGKVRKRALMDILGQFLLSDDGNQYVLMINDRFTKWFECLVFPNQMAAKMSRCSSSSGCRRG